MSERDKLTEIQKAFYDGYDKGYSTAEDKLSALFMANISTADKGLMPLMKELSRANVDLTEQVAQLREAGDGLKRAVIGLRVGSLMPRENEDSDEIVMNYLEAWQAALEATEDRDE